MKRIVAVFLVTALMLCLCGCFKENGKAVTKGDYEGICESGVWISFSEINSMLKSADGFESQVAAAVQNCKSLDIGNVYIHVRSYCDSLYPSDYFPLSDNAQNLGFDAFGYMLTAFRNEGIKVHAWINPYRVLTSSSDIEALPKNSPAYIWAKDEYSENDINVCFCNGIYLNPASAEVRKLIIDGIREIATKYPVDGIHMDDYFYPTADVGFDSQSYEKYSAVTENPLCLEDWRRANVNTLIEQSYEAIKSQNKDIEFSISPAAGKSNNYSSLFADVDAWVSGGYVDTIVPQIYFGYEYPNKEYRFDNLLNEWKKTANKNKNVKLYIGLATYKIGTDSKPDCDEWQAKDDIIARQTKQCMADDTVSGYVFFSYSSLFGNGVLNTAQRENYIKYGRCDNENG